MVQNLSENLFARKQGDLQRRYWLWALGVSVVAYYFLGSGASAAGGSLTIDGLAFPAALKMGGITQQLTGGGTRVKYGVAKVYAAALYIDSVAGASSLKKFAGSAALTKQPKFFTALIDGSFARTLALQFHRSVSSEQMVGALDEAMAKRLPAETVGKFREALLRAFGTDAIAKGAEVYFMCRGATLSIGSGSTSISSTVKEKGVCPALFDVYYGKQPISPAVKEGVALGFSSRGFYH